jgi:hypothetical protein
VKPSIEVQYLVMRDPGSAEAWIRTHVQPIGAAEVVRARPWATTARIPTTDGPVWFKACAPSHSFEPELVAGVAAGWADLVPELLAHDVERGWLLLGDAGVPFDRLDNPPELWLQLLPRYAELQRDFTPPASVPDRNLERWPELFAELAASELPLQPPEIERLRAHGPRFTELCARLAEHGLPPAIQHDDLHHRNAFVDGDRLRIIDWGDASRSHPFVSLVVTFRFLEERNGLSPSDPWFVRLRDAYLEPWGEGLSEASELSQQLGRFVHAFGWLSLRPLLPEDSRAGYDTGFATVLRRALALA